ncbi:MAG: tetratricopeptide repeat protein [Myxococcota bacterium]
MKIRERFAALAEAPDARLDLEEGAILIAAEEYPELDEAGVRAELDRLGTEAATRIASQSDPDARVEALHAYLFDEEGFAGAEAYYDPRNSYLNDVLTRRIGIPITLALVYMSVGRRARLDLRGISFPGHFLVRAAVGEDRYLDAFHGRTLEMGEIETRLAATLGANVALRPEIHLRDATSREILVRMLTNLQQIFAQTGDVDRLLSCCDRILLLTPHNPVALRDRALVYQSLGWFAAAVSDLESALEWAPEGELSLSLSTRRDALRSRMGPVH